MTEEEVNNALRDFDKELKKSPGNIRHVECVILYDPPLNNIVKVKLVRGPEANPLTEKEVEKFRL